MRKLLIAVPFLILANISALAQFNSGSTGADGALDLSNCFTGTCYVQLPESGVLNYTTVNIPVGKTLRFRKNLLNTPAIILATGNVIIAGNIAAVGEAFNAPFFIREPGPGGYAGGEANGNGLGPGGGIQSNTPANGGDGQWIGNVSLVPITGGSGGGGHGYSGNRGGGGGGAVVIASSSSIQISGSVAANGYRGGCNGFGCGGWGSGGAIRLVANSITGAGSLEAFGGGPNGVIRLEAQNGQVTFTGTSNPIAVVAPINPVIIQPNQATLKITTVGPYAVSPYAMGRPDRIDVLLPTNLPDPIGIGVEGANVPSGTDVQIVVSGAGTATPCTLAGGPGTMTCTGSISGLSRVGISTIMAYVIYPPPTSLAKFNPKGENQVAKIRLESQLGAKQKFVFLNKKGREIVVNKLNPKFLKEFGM